jgi:hypothetical protein
MSAKSEVEWSLAARSVLTGLNPSWAKPSDVIDSGAIQALMAPSLSRIPLEMAGGGLPRVPLSLGGALRLPGTVGIRRGVLAAAGQLDGDLADVGR